MIAVKKSFQKYLFICTLAWLGSFTLLFTLFIRINSQIYKRALRNDLRSTRLVSQLANLRDNPSIFNSVTLKEYKRGEIIHIIERKNPWVRIFDPSGLNGWLREQRTMFCSELYFIAIKPISDTEGRVIGTNTKIEPLSIRQSNNYFFISLKTTQCKISLIKLSLGEIENLLW